MNAESAPSSGEIPAAWMPAVPVGSVEGVPGVRGLTPARQRQLQQLLYAKSPDAWERRWAWSGTPRRVTEALPEAYWQQWMAKVDERARVEEWEALVGGEFVFSNLYEPLAAAALKEVGGVWSRLDPGAKGGLLTGLVRELSAHARQGLYLAFDAFRAARVSAGGSVEGDHYAAFSGEFWTESGQARLLAALPGLPRLLAILCSQWAVNTRTLLERLEGDAGRIEETFGIEAGIGALLGVVCPGGDRHHGGQGVRILEFAGGKVVYKPRTLDAEAAWSRVLAAYSGQMPELTLPAMRVLDCQGSDGQAYGWAEFIDVGHFRDGDIPLYYRRCGALLALVHLFGGSDFHMENLIATAAGPVLIDAECLMQPSQQQAAGESAESSVMRTGLLPQPSRRQDGTRVDISGFGGEGGYRMAVERTVYAPLNHGEMRPRSEPATAAAAQNLPLCAGVARRPEPFANEVEAGFRQAHETIQRHAAQWDALLREFQQARVRCLIRPTSAYGRAIWRAVQPAALAEGGQAWATIFEDLVVPLARSHAPPPVWPAVEFEERSLWQYDIPVFHTTGGTRDAWFEEHCIIPGFFAASGLDAALRRLAAWDGKDCDLSCTLVRQALAREESGAGHVASASAAPAILPKRVISKEELPGLLHDTVMGLADKVVSMASRDAAGNPSWVQTMVTVPGQEASSRSGLGGPVYLYSGSLGIALFLKVAEVCGGHEAAGQLVREMLPPLEQALLHPMIRENLRREPIGAVTGLGSVVQVLLSLAALEPSGSAAEARLARLAAELVALVPMASLEADREHDVMSGLAGWLIALCNLEEQFPDTAGRSRVGEVTALLLSKRAPSADGKSPAGWKDGPGRPLAGGLTHGAMGVALALARAYRLHPSAELQQAVADCLEVESLAYDEALGGWPFVVDRTGRKVAINAWCNGAAGMSLGWRAIQKAMGADAPPFARQNEALQQLVRGAFTVADHVCCGNAGRLGIAHALSLPDESGRAPVVPASLVAKASALLLGAAQERGGFSLDGGTIDSSPLCFRGISGIGQVLFRLLAPEQVPDVLALETMAGSRRVPVEAGSEREAAGASLPPVVGSAAPGFMVRSVEPTEAAMFQNMTFPAYRHLLGAGALQVQGKVLAMIAMPDTRGGSEIQVAGLLVAVLREEEAELLSVFVAPAFRQQGAATALVQALVQETTRHQLPRARVVYTSGKDSIPHLEKILAAGGWSAPVPRMLSLKHNSEKAIRGETAWCREMALDEGWEIVPWFEVTDAQREAMVTWQKDSRLIPEELYPPRVESLGPLEPATSIALLIEGRLSGWVLTHRLGPDLVRFTAAYVLPELQPRGWMLGLLHNSIQRAERAGIFFGLWTTPMHLKPMVRFIKKRMAPTAEYCRETRESVWAPTAAS